MIDSVVMDALEMIDSVVIEALEMIGLVVMGALEMIDSVVMEALEMIDSVVIDALEMIHSVVIFGVHVVRAAYFLISIFEIYKTVRLGSYGSWNVGMQMLWTVESSARTSEACRENARRLPQSRDRVHALTLYITTVTRKKRSLAHNTK